MSRGEGSERNEIQNSINQGGYADQFDHGR